MTTFITILCTIMAVLTIVGIITSVIAIVHTPFSIVIRTDQAHTLEFQFGYHMEEVWDCAYWLTITRMYLDPDGIPYNGDMLFCFWRKNKRVILQHKALPEDTYPLMMINKDEEPQNERGYMSDLSYFDDHL